ncbi:MAG: rhomboid family intramembrane serine protease [Planctomycetota bacterium]
MTSYDDGYGRPQMQLALPPLTPWVKRLLIANVTVFVFFVVVGLGSIPLQNRIIDFLAIDPDMWRSFIPAVWQWVTYAFVHDMNGLGHLFFNMLMLYFFGTMLEGIIGSRRFITHYLIAAVAGAVLHLAFMLMLGRTSTAIGASGAVLGVTVAAATLRPHAQVLFLFIPVKLWVLAAVLVAFDVYPLIRELSGGLPEGRVAHFVHLGGALYGFVAARQRWLWRDPLAVLERKRAVAQTERQIGDQQRLDALLDKINREGIGSLSRSEKAFLKKASARSGRR